MSRRGVGDGMRRLRAAQSVALQSPLWGRPLAHPVTVSTASCPTAADGPMSPPSTHQHVARQHAPPIQRYQLLRLHEVGGKALCAKEEACRLGTKMGLSGCMQFEAFRYI